LSKIVKTRKPSDGRFYFGIGNFVLLFQLVTKITVLVNRKKSLNICIFSGKSNELVLAIRPFYVPDLDGGDKRPIPSLGYNGGIDLTAAISPF
jgi:hypothetical protein